MDQVKWLLGPLVLFAGQLLTVAIAIFAGLIPALLNHWWQDYRRYSLEHSSGIVGGCIAGVFNLAMGVALFFIIGFNVMAWMFPVIDGSLRHAGFHNTWGGPVLQALDFLSGLLNALNSFIFG